MFQSASAYTQVLCGNTWIESTATKSFMFYYAGSNGDCRDENCDGAKIGLRHEHHSQSTTPSVHSLNHY